MFRDIAESWKGSQYAKESWRFVLISNRQAIFQGNHQDYILLFVDGAWQCDCEAWERRSVALFGAWCRHTFALQCILTKLDHGTAQVCQGELAH